MEEFGVEGGVVVLPGGGNIQRCMTNKDRKGRQGRSKAFRTPHVDSFAFTIISSYSRNCRFTTLMNTEQAYNLKQQLAAQLATHKQRLGQGQLFLVGPRRSSVLQYAV